jgi:hypothetical protein
MLVGIVDNTNPTGVVALKQIWRGADVATAKDAFINAVTPARNPADWFAFDTGWTTVQQPSQGNRWAWDFDNSVLAQVARSAIIQVCSVLNFDDGTDWSITQDGSWQTLRRFVINPTAICGPELPRFVLRPRFAYQSTSGAPQLRVTENGSLFGQARQLPDSPSWSRNSWSPQGAPGAGMNTYAIEGDRNGATLFELRGLTIELARRID